MVIYTYGTKINKKERYTKMKASAITKKLDELGRLVIPKELRRAIGVKEGDTLKFELNGNTLILTKFESTCLFCGSSESLVEFKGKHVCAECQSSLTNA